MKPAERHSLIPPSAPSLDEALHTLLDEGRAPDLVVQPIVDLKRGVVVGYETLSRFRGPPAASPDKWFEAARRAGRAMELEARVLERALTLRDELPRNCFLSVNVAPEALLDERVAQLLRVRPLARMVFELTEHSAVADYDVLGRAIREVRGLGGFVAVDDAGAGYASLAHILLLRPDFVKLDRALVANVDGDEAKAALVEMFGGFVSRIDGWLLAEGIETRTELDRLVDLGVPLGQGYLLGRPAPAMKPLDAALSAHIEARRSQRKDAVQTAAHASERVPSARDLESDAVLSAWFLEKDGSYAVALLDELGRCASLALRGTGGAIVRRSALVVLETTPVDEALDRALTRPAEGRFDPLVTCDERGRYRGLLRLERLIELARGRALGTSLRPPGAQLGGTSRPPSG